MLHSKLRSAILTLNYLSLSKEDKDRAVDIASRFFWFVDLNGPVEPVNLQELSIETMALNVMLRGASFAREHYVYLCLIYGPDKVEHTMFDLAFQVLVESEDDDLLDCVNRAFKLGFKICSSHGRNYPKDT